MTLNISIRHTRKVARDNAVKYQWRVLQLLPGAERPSYAGLRVEVLERADGELLIRYQGEAVDYQEAPLRSPALWREGSGTFPTPEGPEATEERIAGHLDRDQRKLLAALQSSVQKRAKTKKAAGQGKPLRHQLQRTPTATQQARWDVNNQDLKDRKSRNMLLSSDSVTLIEKRKCHPG